MAVTNFTPNNKGKFETKNGKRVFPPEWYAAQAARRKKNADGTYKPGQFKESRKAPDKELLPSAKVKRKMPDSWYEKQAKKAAERKEAQARGEYTRKVRGKASEYKAKKEAAIKKDSSFKSDGTRRVELDSYESVQAAFMQLGKGRKCDVDVDGKVETVTVKGSGIYPMTRVAVTSTGKIVIVDTNNIKAGYFY